MSITEWLVNSAIHLIEVGGYLGVIFALALDSCGIPIPSEAVLALSGSLARTGHFNLIVIVVIGAVGQVFGAAIAYGIGRYGGEPFVKRYGKYLLISAHDYDKTKRWFADHGSGAIFISRLIPVIRTFSGFPAGTFRMPFGRFIRDSLAGSALWSVLFVGLGFWVGDSWRRYIDKLHYLDYIVLIVVFGLLIRYVYVKKKGLHA